MKLSWEMLRYWLKMYTSSRGCQSYRLAAPWCRGPSSTPDSELSATSPACGTAECLPFQKDGGASAESGRTNRSWGATCSRLFIKILGKGHSTKFYYSWHKTPVKLRNKTQSWLSHLEPNPREITVLDHKINPMIFSNIWPIKTYSIFKTFPKPCGKG